MGCISSVTATLFLACACGADKMQLLNSSSIGSFDQQSMILLLVAVVVSFLLGGATSMLTRKKATLRHCVMGKFTVSATEEQKQAMIVAVLGMVRDIPQICKISAGLDESLADGNYGFAAAVDFKSAADYLIYAKHPAHLAVISNNIKPILQQGTRTAVQFKL